MVSALRELWSSSPAAFWPLLLAGLYFLVMAVWLSVIDIREQRLPNRIVFPSMGIAGVLLLLTTLLMHDAGAALRVIVGAAVCWLLYSVLRIISPSSMGYGDVKLAFVLGLYLGFVSWSALFWGTVLAFLLGAVWGVALIVSRRGNRKSQIPFGPFMLAGTLVALVLG